MPSPTSVLPRTTFALSAEQTLFRDAMERLLGDAFSPAVAREAEAAGDALHAPSWAVLVDAGIPMLRASEAKGGAGGGLMEAVLFAESAGEKLAVGPVNDALAIGQLLSALDTSAADDWLEHLSSGVPMVLAWPERRRGPLLVPAPGRVAELHLNGDRVSVVPPGGSPLLLAKGDLARRAFGGAIEEWKILSAATLTGLGTRALGMAADYARERHAFGRPIGSYQGLAHPLADAVTDMDGARLLLWKASWASARRTEDAGAIASMGFWWAGAAAGRATTRALRVFGGYGVSTESDIQLYYRRTRALAGGMGDPRKELLTGGRRLWNGEAVDLPEAGETPLELGLGSDADQFANEVADFFDRNLTPDLRAKAHHSVAGFDPAFNRALAKAGLLFPHWPEAHGGRGRTLYDMAALHAVFERYGWENVTSQVTNQVAQLVMRYATPKAISESMPLFASGEALACMGFTEPSCGSDVFAAQTRAVRSKDGGDDWVINGSKIFTTSANLASYCFLLARTNPDVPKHAGLTLFLVPMTTPGIEVQAVHTIQDERTNAVYFSDVRLADCYRIGDVDGGLAVMAATLGMEHAAGNAYRLGHAALLEAVTAWARSASYAGAPILDDRDVAGRLMEATCRLEVSTLLCYRAIWASEEGVTNAAWGPMAKLFATEAYLRDATDLSDLTASHDPIPAAVSHVVQLGFLQSVGTTIYGGTSEIHRSLIAEQALGMPRSRS